MRRPAHYYDYDWDSPLWQLSRLLVDIVKDKTPTATEIRVLLADKHDVPAARALGQYLRAHPEWLDPLADHLAFRMQASVELMSHLRTEEQALSDLAKLGDIEVATYGTRSSDHHQSSKVVVQTVAALTNIECDRLRVAVDLDPQQRASLSGDGYLWVSPRRLDGAIPGLVNPVGVWEIKEYWGKTKGGSKMSDAIYELHLVGLEIRDFERRHDGVSLKHYAILDGAGQWVHRKADLRRAVDLLCMGLLDELIVGDEMLTEWPRIVTELCERV